MGAGYSQQMRYAVVPEYVRLFRRHALIPAQHHARQNGPRAGVQLRQSVFPHLLRKSRKPEPQRERFSHFL